AVIALGLDSEAKLANSEKQQEGAVDHGVVLSWRGALLRVGWDQRACERRPTDKRRQVSGVRRQDKQPDA
ncbi:MAG: hypothetical protein B7Z73_11200, partial [Planctomycetia bacterium 21-64-5]